MDKYIVLNNGIKVAINNHYDIVSRIIIAIMAGSRDCGNELCGLAHFSEHILLTDMHDKKDAIINCDGKTTNEETVISLTCLNDDLGFINVLLTSAIKHGNSDYVEGFLQTEFDFTEEESKNYVQELIKKYGHLVDVSEMSENPKP